LENIELIFDHVGIPTDEAQPGESWVEATRVWVTNPHTHKYHVEYLRFAPDSPAAEVAKVMPHIAYAVSADALPKLVAQAAEVIVPITAVDDNLTIAYVMKDGALLEYMVYKDPTLWFGKPRWG
jgi:hypothetical protein